MIPGFFVGLIFRKIFRDHKLVLPHRLTTIGRRLFGVEPCCSIHRLELIACSPPVVTISLHVSTYHRLNGSSSPVLTATCLSYGSLCDFLGFFPQPTWRSHPSTDFDVKWLKRRGFTNTCALWSNNPYGTIIYVAYKKMAYILPYM